MKRVLVREVWVNGEEKSLKNLKKYLFGIKSRFNKKYFDELKLNQNIIRKFIPVVTVDAYNLLDATAPSIALKKIQNNAVVLMEVRYQDDVIGKLSVSKKKDKIKIYLEYENKTNVSALLTIF